MFRAIRRDARTMIIAVVAASLTAGGPAIAHGVHAAFAHNADKVDGIHAVPATKAAKGAKKLVATDSKGKLPTSVMNTAPDSVKLGGQTLSQVLAQAQDDVSVAINTTGALPRSGEFTSGVGGLLITASGSGWFSDDNPDTVLTGTFGFDIKLDNKIVGRARMFANVEGQHMTIPTETVLVTGVSAGDHTVTLEAVDVNGGAAGTTRTDFNDYFNVTVIEVPKPTFGLGCAPESWLVVNSRGANQTSTCEVVTSGAFDKQVTFSCVGLTGDATCTFDPPSVPGNGTTTLTFDPNSTRSQSFRVKATGGGITRNVAFSYTCVQIFGSCT